VRANRSIGLPEQQSRVLNEVLHALLVRAGTLKEKKKAVPGCLPHNKVRTVLLFASAKPAMFRACLVHAAKVQFVLYILDVDRGWPWGFRILIKK
jgi:hypothetical protein